MTETADPGEDEALLDFLDEAWGLLLRGQPADTSTLSDPRLAARGRRLLDDLLVVLRAAGGLTGEWKRLLGDALDLSDGAAPGEALGVADDPVPDPFPGEFRVRSLLGRGAFGKVFLADDLGLGRAVALKAVLTGGRKAAADRLRMLREEARVLASIRHPNVVQVHAWRQAADGACYIVMDYVAGGSLAARVRDEGPLPWRKAARLAADVGEGLLAVHAAGLVHRDVKPANILWDRAADRAVLTDLGVSVRLHLQGTAAGTPFYMPPEAHEGVVGPAHDVFGLAASLFWLATGHLPFPGPTMPMLREQSRRGLPPDDPRAAALPAALLSIVRAGLAADPAARPPLGDFLASLRGTLNRLLADHVAGLAGRPGGPVRLLISRRTAPHTYEPLAIAHPKARAVRDVRLVPEDPERASARTGDRLRIEVEIDVPGYLTVFNVGPTGNLNPLYPPERAVPAPSEAGRPIRIGETVLSGPCGQERLVAVWSRGALTVPLEQALSGAPPGPARASRDLALLGESVSNLPPDEWHAAVVELEHLPHPEVSP